MHQKQIKKIKINGTTFSLDCRYQLVLDLISDQFEKQSCSIDQLFGRDDKSTKILIDAVLEEGCDKDIAMTYFIAMALENYGEIERAGRAVAKMYERNSSDLLAKCAYVNHLMFANEVNKIPAVFNNTFDLDKICIEREMPLIIFVKFMSLVCDYYIIKNDPRNFLKYFSYLKEVAPEHGDTQRLSAMLRGASD